MNKNIMIQTTEGSFNGTMSFPQVVQALIQEGVESYTVDLVQNIKTFYMPNGEVFVEKFKYDGPRIATDFSQDKVVAAIRASQTQKIKYPQFLKEILEAGTTSYIVYIEGRKAVYFGRKGETHTENFPQAK